MTSKTHLKTIFILFILILTSACITNTKDTSKDIGKASVSQHVAINKIYKSIAITCNQTELPESCFNTKHSISVNYENAQESTYLIIKKDQHSFTHKLSRFFEGLNYNTHLFKSDNEFILVIDLIYEYNNKLLFFKIDESSNISYIDELLIESSENTSINNEMLITEENEVIKIEFGNSNTKYLEIQKQTITKAFSFYKNDTRYFVKNIDINKDGKLDKIVSSKKNQGNSLLLFIATDDTHNLAFETINFSEDGGNQIYDIKETVNGFNIITQFPDRGFNEKTFKVTYLNNQFILDSVILKSANWQNNPDQTDVCKLEVNKNLSYFNSLNFIAIQEEEKKCSKEFTISQKTINDYVNVVKTEAKKYRTVERYKKLLETFPLTKNNLTAYNDIAYYLEQAGNYDEAHFLLEKIIINYPDRVVAYLNIADVYWALNEKEKANNAYNQYISLMTKDNKTDKIPQRVLKRTQ